ncbi:unnamed protein product [Prunus brigantina]
MDIKGLHEERIKILQQLSGLQVEKDNLLWRERELNVKNDIADVFRRSSAVVDSRISDLGIEIQKQIEERKMIEAKLEEASREPGRKEIIEEFKALVSSFPEEMGTMQGQLRKYKKAASYDLFSFINFFVQDLKESESELKMILKMYRHELTDPSIELDGRVRTPKWNWMRCEKNWQLMS